MNIKAIIATVAVLSVNGLITTSRAQLPQRPPSGEIPRQSVYMELGGNAVVYSLNYDVIFHNNWGFRLGGSYYPAVVTDNVSFNSSVGSDAFLGLAMGLHLFGTSPNYLETGAGLLFGTIYEPEKWHTIKPPGLTLTLGYRYLPEDYSRFTFKAAFTPIINSDGFHPYVGLSFGITLTPQGDAHPFQ